ncbi:hypothetical protein [Streptomyces zagrosensis]|uniref:Uncharacterized protein n=1 Tax=Streptomyces zagrosensis TaxID=1042984 RepID=A0A7W9Q7B7_9ACTN|nr:hypothetical protein [Streptomyces zagrosensis]MBB5934513.1 hypothetical protein [Streptomyces zagrosensis]
MIGAVARGFTPKYVFGQYPGSIQAAHALRGVILLAITVFAGRLALPDADRTMWHVSVTVVIVAIVLPLACTVLVIAAGQDRRGWTMRCALRPLGALIRVSVLLGLLWWLAAHLESGSGGGLILRYLGALALAVCCLIALTLVYFHHFNAVDGHPLLPALIGPWPVVVLAYMDADGTFLAWLPALLTTGVSLWEITWLSRVGITFTSGAPDLASAPESV